MDTPRRQVVTSQSCAWILELRSRYKSPFCEGRCSGWHPSDDRRSTCLVSRRARRVVGGGDGSSPPRQAPMSAWANGAPIGEPTGGRIASVTTVRSCPGAVAGRRREAQPSDGRIQQDQLTHLPDHPDTSGQASTAADCIGRRRRPEAAAKVTIGPSRLAPTTSTTSRIIAAIGGW